MPKPRKFYEGRNSIFKRQNCANISTLNVRSLPINQHQCKCLNVNTKEDDQSNLGGITERITCHGLQDLHRAKSRVSFAFWACVLAACSSILCYSIYRCFLEFYENPIVTSVKVTSSPEMQFPDLTICPPDFINYTKLKQITTDGPVAGRRILHFKHLSLAKKAKLLTEDRAFFTPGDHATRYGMYPWAVSLVGVPWQSRNMSVQHEEIFNASLDLNQFIVKSPIDDMKRTLDVEHGVCYVLNATGEKINQSIPHMGITLLVDTDPNIKNSSNPNASPLVNAITVRTGHPKYDPIARCGILIPAGSYAMLSLTVKKEEFITVSGFTNKPEHCHKEGDVELSLFNVPYSQDACELDCFAVYELEKYKCIVATNMTFLKVKNFTSDIEPCASMSYYKEYRENNMLQNCSKKCYKECELSTYEIDTTIVKIPSSALLYKLKANQDFAIGRPCPKINIINASWSNDSCVEEKRQELALYWKKCSLPTDYKFQHDYVNQTFGLETCNESQISEIDHKVKQYDCEWCKKSCNDTRWRDALAEAENWESTAILMEVVFQNFKTRVISQRQSMTPITLLSNLGGTLGLWLGASFFTILQVNALLLEACVRCCQRRKQCNFSWK